MAARSIAFTATYTDTDVTVPTVPYCRLPVGPRYSESLNHSKWAAKSLGVRRVTATQRD